MFQASVLKQNTSRPKYYVHTPWAIKISQLIFLCNFVKNQRILTPFSRLDLKMKGTCDGINLTYLT